MYVTWWAGRLLGWRAALPAVVTQLDPPGPALHSDSDPAGSGLAVSHVSASRACARRQPRGAARVSGRRRGAQDLERLDGVAARDELELRHGGPVHQRLQHAPLPLLPVLRRLPQPW